VLSFKPGPGGGPVIEKPTADNLAITLQIPAFGACNALQAASLHGFYR